MKTPDKVKKKLAELPVCPGVYFHKNLSGRVIYVGKAAVLRNRVRQYFQKSRTRDPKTDALVKEIKDIDWIETESEMDALFLEAEMIKRYKPRYNLAMRDDKSDLYVRIDIKSQHPTVSFTRRPLDDKADYFGPFPNPAGLRKAMKILRKVFPFDYKKSATKNRVSLHYHIGLSPGLEEGKTTVEDYRKNLRRLIMYIKGNRKQLVNQLEKDMNQTAKDKDYERAAELRNKVVALKSLRRQVVFGDREFMDMSKDKGLEELKELVDLDGPPRRIEGYDISHMSGTDNTASMVVFTYGLPEKSQYRKFKLRTPGNDDFAHIKEVVSRRFSGRNASWPKPDLILIDGGKGQLSSAMEALNETGQEIPAVGLAKRQEQLVMKSEEGFEIVNMDKNSHVRKLLIRIRDESHRFAISYHSTLKTKRQSASLLEEIPNVGPVSRKKLLKEFGGMQSILQAREWELAKVVGKSKARIIKQYLRPRKKPQA